jgi:thioredoxin-like negative regulator of GroEL
MPLIVVFQDGAPVSGLPVARSSPDAIVDEWLAQMRRAARTEL